MTFRPTRRARLVSVDLIIVSSPYLHVHAEFVSMLDRRWLGCFTRLLSEFEGRFVQLVGLKAIGAANLTQRQREEGTSGSNDDLNVDQGLEPTGREKEELLQYFLANPLMMGERNNEVA
jgi:hypothetical protein